MKSQLKFTHKSKKIINCCHFTIFNIVLSGKKLTCRDLPCRDLFFLHYYDKYLNEYSKTNMVFLELVEFYKYHKVYWLGLVFVEIINKKMFFVSRNQRCIIESKIIDYRLQLQLDVKKIFDYRLPIN